MFLNDSTSTSAMLDQKEKLSIPYLVFLTVIRPLLLQIVVRKNVLEETITHTHTHTKSKTQDTLFVLAHTWRLLSFVTVTYPAASGFIVAVSPKTNNMTMTRHRVLLGLISSNGYLSIVMLVFPGSNCIYFAFEPVQPKFHSCPATCFWNLRKISVGSVRLSTRGFEVKWNSISLSRSC